MKLLMKRLTVFVLGFTQSSCRNVHMKRHEMKKIYSCEICNETFSFNSNLIEHMAAIHDVD